MLGLDAPKHITLEHSRAPNGKRYDLSKLSLDQLRALRDLQREAQVNEPIDVAPLEEDEEVD